jgi:CRP-like cAMP-binding protein
MFAHSSIETKLSQFFSRYQTHTFEKETAVLKAGSAVHSFFYIQEGSVKMSTTSSSGQNLTLHIYQPKSCFPLVSLTESSPQSLYDFFTLTTTKLAQVPRVDFINFIQSDAEVSYYFLLRMIRGSEGLLKRIQQTAFVPAFNQVAGVLLYFALHYGKQQEDEVQLSDMKFTHQDIAEWLGLSRENVSIQMKKLEREGLVNRKNGHIVITQFSELQRLQKNYEQLTSSVI